MKRLVAIAALALLGTACAPAQDGISGVIGPNPISDGRAILHQATNNGWSSAQANKLTEELVDELDVSQSQAECMRDRVISTWTLDEWMATTGDEPELASMITACFG